MGYFLLLGTPSVAVIVFLVLSRPRLGRPALIALASAYVVLNVLAPVALGVPHLQSSGREDEIPYLILLVLALRGVELYALRLLYLFRSRWAEVG